MPPELAGIGFVLSALKGASQIEVIIASGFASRTNWLYFALFAFRVIHLP
jgi:hypothetical protein